MEWQGILTDHWYARGGRQAVRGIADKGAASCEGGRKFVPMHSDTFSLLLFHAPLREESDVYTIFMSFLHIFPTVCCAK